MGTSRNNTVFSSANNPAIRSLVPRLACRQHSRSLQSRSISAKIIQNVGSGTNIYVAAGNAFAAIVHLLESTNRFKILSRPTVFTSNNKKAIIASGRKRFPCPASTLTNASDVINNSCFYPIEHRIQEGGASARGRSAHQFREGSVTRYFAKDRQPCTERKRTHQRQSGANNRHEVYSAQMFPRGNGSTIILGGLIQEQKQKHTKWHSLYLAHSAHRRGIPWHSNWQAATGVNHSYVPAGDADQAGVLQAASKVGEHVYAFWPGAGSERVSRLPQNARGQTVNIAATRYSRTERYEVNSICVMKRIALALVLCP